ncbi:MAG TPA: hypothetical protein VEY90_07085 [Thermoleophilaceae bacterium]|jgi:hypothetical protein|nr:hypothetical protein [Thermoleophilaceae bacterium]
MHTLVLYGSSRRADASLRDLARRARAGGARLTVLSLVRQEPERRRCCDMRSPMWNEICRELGQEDLTRAYRAVDGDDRVELDTLLAGGRRAADAVAVEALRRRADAIALADPRASGLGPLERRRLRRRSPVPVLG